MRVWEMKIVCKRAANAIKSFVKLSEWNFNCKFLTFTTNFGQKLA